MAIRGISHDPSALSLIFLYFLSSIMRNMNIAICYGTTQGDEWMQAVQDAQDAMIKEFETNIEGL